MILSSVADSPSSLLHWLPGLPQYWGSIKSLLTLSWDYGQSFIIDQILHHLRSEGGNESNSYIWRLAGSQFLMTCPFWSYLHFPFHVLVSKKLIMNLIHGQVSWRTNPASSCARQSDQIAVGEKLNVFGDKYQSIVCQALWVAWSSASDAAMLGKSGSY